MTKLPRRQFLQLAAGAAALPVVSRIARAQAYPARPVRIVLGFQPGVGPDVFIRLIGQQLSERFGQTFVVENRPGAASNIATETVVRAAPDGYSLLVVTVANAINTTLYEKLNFNLIRDITPIAAIYRATGVLVVNPSLPAKTVTEFVAYAKANPGKINMASAGHGAPSHLYGELFKAMTDVNMVHVPYRTGALTDVLGGQAQVTFSDMAGAFEHIKSGKLRALAVTSATRSHALPDVPTVGEFVPGYEAGAWIGVGAPRNTPADVVERLNKEINAILADPRIQARLADLGYVGIPGSPADFGKLVADETEKWGKVIRAYNIKPV